MALDLGGNKKKPNDKSKYSIVELSLFKPGKKKYSEFDYEEIRKKQLKEDDSSGDDERFHDREALEIVKRLEAKYGGKKDKKGRKLRFGNEDDYMDKRAGYDLDDDFIDDSEAYDELIPSTMDTLQGGFYVNRGKLEFKTRHEEVNDSDISDSDEAPQPKKGTKRVVVSSDDEVEVVEDAAAPVATASTSGTKTVSEAPAPVPIAPKPRMVGAPPTKVRRITLGESANQRAANAIKKRLVGMPPTLLKRKVLQTAVTRKENEMSDFLRSMAGGDVPVDDDIIEVVASTSAQPATTSKSPEKASTVDIASSSSTSVPSAPAPSQNSAPTTSSDASSSTAVVPPSPVVDSSLPLLFSVSVPFVSEKETSGSDDRHFVQNDRRVQTVHEQPCFTWAKEALAEHTCGHGDREHKNGAPNLALLAKSGAFGGPRPAAYQKSAAPMVTVPATVKPTSAVSVPSTSKTAVIPTPTTSVSSSAKTTTAQVPSTSTASSSSVTANVKPPVVAPPPAASSASSSGTSNPSSTTTTPPKPSSSWTNQKKLAAQSMITNVAGLATFKGRVAELQEILRKVANETISYEDFIKWHDSSMKPAPVKVPSEQKPVVNGAAKPSPSASNPIKATTTHAANAAKESSAAQPVCSTLLSAKSAPNVTTVPVKRTTLAQAMASATTPSRSRPLTLTSAQVAEKFEGDKQDTIRAISVAIENSKTAHKKKCDARALRNQLDLYWSVILASDSYTHATEGIVTIFAKEIYPLFRGEIKLSITIVTKKDKTETDSTATKVKSSRSFSTILPVRSSSDDVQSSTSQDDADVVAVEPSTSCASSSNGDIAAASTPSTSTSSAPSFSAAAAASALAASNQAVAALNGMGLTMTPTQIAELTAAMQQLSTLTTDPQKLLVLQQTLMMQVMTHNQVEAKRKQEEERKKEEERKRKAEEEKEAKRRAKEEEKLKIVSSVSVVVLDLLYIFMRLFFCFKIAQKKALAQCAKEKALEEKRLRLEEEKKQKLAEKARKAEEEREKRLQEQAERERLMREERERQAREEAERKKKEEEERQRLEEIRVKIEEEKAAQLLEEEILLEDPSEVPPERKLELEEEEQAESLRLKKQEEQLAAVRAANLAAQAQQAQAAAACPQKPRPATPQPTAVTMPPEQKPLATPPKSMRRFSHHHQFSLMGLNLEFA
ncbi:hypothetical protein ANCCEY_08731 [Ancylostoma ceylanicum]|uniref:Hpc2-related domain-containing protein n=1 Tax=Ancylostoma ceylanicum TaxID=53326 RepID=A0A0D6LLU9_9BILA|nr:hypothetical protein ANCCEY_08731 [Ancylostoma ceylanicum]